MLFARSYYLTAAFSSQDCLPVRLLKISFIIPTNSDGQDIEFFKAACARAPALPVGTYFIRRVAVVLAD